MKGLARELQIPIVLLAQLNREVARGEGHRKPRLSDLKDSGSIEQDADLVLFLYRPETDEITPDGGVLVELIVAKQRNGPTGSIRLSWYEKETRFATYRDVAEEVDRRLPMEHECG